MPSTKYPQLRLAATRESDRNRAWFFRGHHHDSEASFVSHHSPVSFGAPKAFRASGTVSIIGRIPCRELKQSVRFIVLFWLFCCHTPARNVGATSVPSSSMARRSFVCDDSATSI